jgi:predicted MFS family arabinose efflux permease
VTSVVLVLGVAAMASLPVQRREEDCPRPSIPGGFRSIVGDRVLLGAYLVDLNAMVFGAPSALFPALNHSLFGGDPGTLGLLYAAPGAGALVGALTTGWLERIRRQGIAIVVAVAVWGAAIAAFGLVHALWGALLLLAVAGWVDVLSAVLRTTLLQTHASEALRGRVASVQMAVVEGGPRLGGFESGALAAATSTEFSIVAGGLAALIGALLVGAALPGFRRYRRPDTATRNAAAIT